MQIKNCHTPLLILVVAAFSVNSVFASGRGHASGAAHGASTGLRTIGGNHWGNPGNFLQSNFGCFGTSCGYRNGWWGGAGNGSGYGYGYGYPNWGYSPWVFDYELEGVPHFAQFPPVYYGYSDNMPVLKNPIGSSWVGNGSVQSVVDSPATTSPPRPPLRIVNPYYTEDQAEKR